MGKFFFFLAKITWDPTVPHSLAVTCKEPGRSQGPTQLHMGAACMHRLAQRHRLPLATLNSPCHCESHHELTHWYLRGSAERRFSRPSEQTLSFGLNLQQSAQITRRVKAVNNSQDFFLLYCALWLIIKMFESCWKEISKICNLYLLFLIGWDLQSTHINMRSLLHLWLGFGLHPDKKI